MFDNLYYYKVRVVRVYDGDTIHVDIDLGLSTWIKKEKLRLARINAPEIRGSQRPAGLAARDFLRNLILDKEVIVQTIKDRKGKYGRYLAEIWLQTENGWENVNDRMLAEGFARPYSD